MARIKYKGKIDKNWIHRAYMYNNIVLCLFPFAYLLNRFLLIEPIHSFIYSLILCIISIEYTGLHFSYSNGELNFKDSPLPSHFWVILSFNSILCSATLVLFFSILRIYRKFKFGYNLAEGVINKTIPSSYYLPKIVQLKNFADVLQNTKTIEEFQFECLKNITFSKWVLYCLGISFVCVYIKNLFFLAKIKNNHY